MLFTKFSTAFLVTMFAFSYLSVSGAFAISVPSDQIFLDFSPGEGETFLLPIFSDSTTPTDVAASKKGFGSSLIFLEDNIGTLPPGAVHYIQVGIFIPEDYVGPFNVNPEIVITEKVNINGQYFQIDQEKKKVHINIIPLEPAENETESETETENETETETEEESSSGSNENEETETEDGTEVETNETSEETEGETETEELPVSNETAEDDVEVPVEIESPEDDGADQEVTDVEDVVEEDRETEEDRAAVLEEAFIDDVRVVDEVREIREERKERKEKRNLKKLARKIENLKERSQVSDVVDVAHNFELEKNDIKKVAIALASRKSNVSIVVETLSVTKVEEVETEDGEIIETVIEETNEDGVIPADAEIVPLEKIPEEERDSTILIGDVEIPDIELEITEEIVEKDEEKQEVTRRITQNKAYKYLEINVEGVDTVEVESANIDFEVEKSWLADNGIDPSFVRMNRLVGDEWVELETVLLSEDETSYQFSAVSEGFSFFVITASVSADVLTPIQIETTSLDAVSESEFDALSEFTGENPENEVSITISWVLLLVIAGAVIVIKYKEIKNALVHRHADQDELNSLEKERSMYEKMKEETTKRYYKRKISEDEFKSLMRDYDSSIIKLEAKISQIKEPPKPKQ